MEQNNSKIEDTKSLIMEIEALQKANAILKSNYDELYANF